LLPRTIAKRFSDRVAAVLEMLQVISQAANRASVCFRSSSSFTLCWN